MSPDSAAPDPDRIQQPADPIPDDVTDVVGVIDAIAGNRVHGWAFDRNHPEERLVVEIFLDDAPVGKVRADALRDGLQQNGIGDGAHGFAVDVPATLSKEEHHRVSAVVSKPGYGGITRLKNQAAANSDAIALRPSDFTALAKNVEQCVDDQRAGFRWIYHELQELDQFIRNEAQNRPAAPALEASAVPDGAAFASQIEEMAQNQTIIHESLEELSAFQKSLNRRLEQFEVINARIDARMDSLEQTREPVSQLGGDQRGLKRLILLLGCLTAASLAMGIVALGR